MGHEAECQIHWQGNSAFGKVLLEPTEIILRGGLRARIPRHEIARTELRGSALHLTIGRDVLVLELGAKRAASWQAAIAKPLPSLAEKLGVTSSSPVFVIGTVTDPELQSAIRGATAQSPQDASLFLAEVHSIAVLEAVVDIAHLFPSRHVWCANVKGSTAAVSDAAIRSWLRESGLIDSKSCAVSDRLSATRYRMRK